MKNEIVNHPRAGTEMYISHTDIPFNIGSLGVMHFHHDLEFLYITNGALCCYTENEISYAHKGDIIFFNSRVPHRCDVIENGTTYTTLQFTNPAQVVDSLKYLIIYLTKMNYPYHIFKKNDDNTQYLSDKITGLLSDSKYKDRIHDYLMIAKKYEIIAFLHQKNFIADESSLIDTKNISSVLPIIDYLHENYQNPITLNDISNSFHLHSNYICKLFKKTTGITVIDYLNYIRINKAEGLLRSGLSVVEVAELTGFSSQSYFNKVFKKYFFCAPSVYKRKIK